MAADLAPAHTGLEVQLCGDAHLSNFGGFASPERDLVFDVNDFDETMPGPFEWDLKRLAASLEIAGPGPGLRRRRTGTTHRGRRARTYREAIRSSPGCTTSTSGTPSSTSTAIGPAGATEAGARRSRPSSGRWTRPSPRTACKAGPS